MKKIIFIMFLFGALMFSKENFAFEGTYSEWENFVNCELINEGRVSICKLKSGDLLEGRVSINFDDTPQRGEYSYKNGMLNGTENVVYDDNVMINKISYKDGLLDGDFYRYYPNGNVFTKQAFKDNELNGESVIYFEDGKINSIEIYDQGIINIEETKKVTKNYITASKIQVFEKENYELVWSAYRDENYFVQEYLKNNDKLEDYKSMILIEVIKNPEVDETYFINSKLDYAKSVTPGSSNEIIEDESGKIISFTMSDGDINEWNIGKVSKNKNDELVYYNIVSRMYGINGDKDLKSYINNNKEKYINDLKSKKLDEIKIER